MKHKRTIAALIGAATIAISLSACAPVEKEPTGNTLPSSNPSAPTTTINKKVSDKDEYLIKARTIFPSASNSELTDLGKQSCAVVDEIGSVAGALLAFATNPSFAGMEEDAAFILGAAIPAFCPEYYAEALALVD